MHTNEGGGVSLGNGLVFAFVVRVSVFYIALFLSPSVKLTSCWGFLFEDNQVDSNPGRRGQGTVLGEGAPPWEV